MKQSIRVVKVIHCYIDSNLWKYFVLFTITVSRKNEKVYWIERSSEDAATHYYFERFLFLIQKGKYNGDEAETIWV